MISYSSFIIKCNRGAHRPLIFNFRIINAYVKKITSKMLAYVKPLLYLCTKKNKQVEL